MTRSELPPSFKSFPMILIRWKNAPVALKAHMPHAVVAAQKSSVLRASERVFPSTSGCFFGSSLSSVEVFFVSRCESGKRPKCSGCSRKKTKQRGRKKTIKARERERERENTRVVSLLFCFGEAYCAHRHCSYMFGDMFALFCFFPAYSRRDLYIDR